jgi:hypothetical protein
MDNVIRSSSVHIMWQSSRYTAILSSFQISSACCIYLDLHWVLFTLEKQMLSIIELVIGGTDRIKNFQQLEGKYKSKDTMFTIYLIVILGLGSRQEHAVTVTASHEVGVAAGEDGTMVNIVDKGTDAEEQFAAYSGEKKNDEFEYRTRGGLRTYHPTDIGLQPSITVQWCENI